MAFKKVRSPQQGEKKRVKVQALFWVEPAMAKLLKRTAARLKVSQSELARAAFAYVESQGMWSHALVEAVVDTPAAGASEEA